MLKCFSTRQILKNLFHAIQKIFFFLQQSMKILSFILFVLILLYLNQQIFLSLIF